MRQRLFVLMLATFGFPIVYLVAETIAWALQAPTVTQTLLKYIPELLSLLFTAWFIAIAYATGRVVWLVTAQLQPWFLRTGARAAGLVTLTGVLFLAGGLVISTWLPQVSVRTVSSAERVGK